MKPFLLLALLATSALAQDFEVGMRHLIVNAGSEVDLPVSRGFAGTAEVFVTPRFSAELSIGFANPEAAYREVDLGTLGLQTTALTARCHLGALFAGAGVASLKIGNLDDQLGDDVEVDFDRETTFLLEGGLRVRLLRTPRVMGIVTVTYMPLTATPNVRKSNLAFPEELSLDPVTVGVGASWRF